MKDSTKREPAGCREVRELVPWYPGGTLAEAERELVLAHVSQCSACADLLAFSTRFKDVLSSTAPVHPQPEELVDFAEDGSRLPPRRRESIAAHLDACPACSEEVGVLGRLQEAADRGAAPRESEPRGNPVRRLWEALERTALGPVPAGVYLAAAAAAIALLLLPRSQVPPPGVGGPAVTANGVIILSDRQDRVRRADREEGREATDIDASVGHLLLLELTGLASPPGEEDEFTVLIRSQGTGESVLETTVLGGAFRENYTIALSLSAGTLAAGAYTVTVEASDGKTVFASALTVR